MSQQLESVNALGLSFFGSMTASISHEIKNALAIINENAGLLGDLALLATKGRELSPDRLHSLSENIRRQVQRADEIIRRLNRFAHSAHEPEALTSMQEIFDFTAALTARLAAMKSVTVTVTQGAAIQATVRSFVVENLLWICLKEVLAATESGRTVELAAEEDNGTMMITLNLGARLPMADIENRARTEGQAILTAMNAVMTCDAANGRITISIPK